MSGKPGKHDAETMMAEFRNRYFPRGSSVKIEGNEWKSSNVERQQSSSLVERLNMARDTVKRPKT